MKQQCSQVLIASDPDREGEAIAYHVAVVLGLPIPSAKRIKFQEITKRAILAAVASPGIINMELVRSQEARRVPAANHAECAEQKGRRYRCCEGRTGQSRVFGQLVAQCLSRGA